MRGFTQIKDPLEAALTEKVTEAEINDLKKGMFRITDDFWDLLKKIKMSLSMQKHTQRFQIHVILIESWILESKLIKLQLDYKKGAKSSFSNF